MKKSGIVNILLFVALVGVFSGAVFSGEKRMPPI